MKPYFAKYLPVKEHFHYVGATIREKSTGAIGIIKKIGEGIDETKVEHVKLFLCSRETVNIKVDIDEQQWREMSRNEKDDYLLKTNQYKVSGEISSDAKWVKEYDEFDEAEIELWWFDSIVRGNPCLRYTKDTKDIVWWPSFSMVVLAKIMGCCGHFH